MQIVEVTGYAVRSAVITMRRRGTPLEFVIFPMLHVASPAFYSQVRLRLRECDLVVIEGIRGKSARVSALTLAYRFAPRRRRNGLQEQREELLLPGDATVIRPDVTAAEAIEDLRTLPRGTYLLLLVAAPVMGLVFALRGPRAFLDEDLAVEDLPSTPRAEMLADDPVARADRPARPASARRPRRDPRDTRCRADPGGRRLRSGPRPGDRVGAVEPLRLPAVRGGMAHGPRAGVDHRAKPVPRGPADVGGTARRPAPGPPPAAPGSRGGARCCGLLGS
ncbi:hypothetical protein RB196_32220 [Streptomyces sp. PmtA]|uniref:hypothetical protein n=1 Tax=Streptomyces sp. PmtA TaxID=3074275 RepID=UPI003014ABE6